jgi:hypothetical protein
VLTRPATGVHADAAYFCKLPDAPVDTMLNEIPRWMFDASHCAAMKLRVLAQVNVPSLQTLKGPLATQPTSVQGPMIQPQLSRHAGHEDKDGEELGTEPKHANGAVSGKPKRTPLGRTGRVSTHRGSPHSGATASEVRGGQSSRKVENSEAR